MKKFLIVLSFVLLITSAFGDTHHYAVMIDAGDETTRLHLYSYEKNNGIPTIQLLFEANESFALSSFANKPEESGNSLKKILEQVLGKLSSIQVDPSLVTLSVLGTEKMRNLSQTTQQEIYNNITQVLKQNYHFQLGDIESITSEKQILLEWLAINYLADNFSKDKTAGVLHIDPYFSGLAFALDEKEKTKEQSTIIINNKLYHLYIKPFPKLSEETLLSEINKNQNSFFCYPLNYPLPREKGSYHFSDCANLYDDVLKKELSQLDIPNLHDQFVIANHAYEIYSFFGIEDPYEQAYETRMNYVCEMPWELMQLEYEGMPLNELSSICAKAVGIERLVYKNFKLNSSSLRVTDKINGKKIDWTMGSLIFGSG